MRLRKHINAAFLSPMMRIKTKYAGQGHASLPKEMSEREKIGAAPPRHAVRSRVHAAHLVERGQTRLRQVKGPAERQGRWKRSPGRDERARAAGLVSEGSDRMAGCLACVGCTLGITK